MIQDIETIDRINELWRSLALARADARSRLAVARRREQSRDNASTTACLPVRSLMKWAF